MTPEITELTNQLLSAMKTHAAEMVEETNRSLEQAKKLRDDFESLKRQIDELRGDESPP